MTKEYTNPILILGAPGFPDAFLDAHFGASMPPERVGEKVHHQPRDTHYALVVVKPGVSVPDTLPQADAVVLLASLEADEAEKKQLDEWTRRWPAARILRTPQPVGTGMTGRWRDMANAIYRGVYVSDTDNDARVSVLHALDLGEAIDRCVACTPEGTVWEVCDGRTPRVADVAEALSRRLSHKRFARLPKGKARMAALLTDIFTLGTAGAMRRLKADSHTITADSAPFLQKTEWLPRNTVEYLTNHNYGPDDI